MLTTLTCADTTLSSLLVIKLVIAFPSRSSDFNIIHYNYKGNNLREMCFVGLDVDTTFFPPLSITFINKLINCESFEGPF